VRGPLRRILTVFTLVSRIPLRASFEPDFSRSDFWLPLIGPFASAAALAGLALGTAAFRDPLLAALCAIVFQYLGFNLFHLDGFLDSADALAGQAAPERRLEILKDPRIGSYALFFGFALLAAKAAAMAALLRLSPAAAVAVILAAPVAGRSAGALVPLLARPAREGGLGALMTGFSGRRVAFGWLLASLPLAACGAAAAAWPGTVLGAPAVWAVAGAASATAAVTAGSALAALYRRKVGGFTGDAIGAAVETGELACLLASLAVLGALAGKAP